MRRAIGELGVVKSDLVHIIRDHANNRYGIFLDTQYLYKYISQTSTSLCTRMSFTLIFFCPLFVSSFFVISKLPLSFSISPPFTAYINYIWTFSSLFYYKCVINRRNIINVIILQLTYFPLHYFSFCFFKSNEISIPS